MNFYFVHKLFLQTSQPVTPDNFDAKTHCVSRLHSTVVSFGSWYFLILFGIWISSTLASKSIGLLILIHCLSTFLRFFVHHAKMATMIVRMNQMKQTVQRLHVLITNSFVHVVARMAHQNVSLKLNFVMVNGIVKMVAMKKQLAVSYFPHSFI